MVLYDSVNDGSVGSFFKVWYGFRSMGGWGGGEGGRGVSAILGYGYGVQ